jgi:post-segregation antitoxin (ccd killing protein)
MQKFREDRTTLSIPRELRGRADDAGLNMSDVARKAIIRALQKSEKETGVAPSKATSPATTSDQGRASHV